MSKNDTKLSIGFLFDDTLDSSDGVAQQVKTLGSWFTQNGHHVVYLCGDSKLKDWAGGKVYSLSRNIKIRFNGNRLSIPLLSRARDIKHVLEAEKLDVIHVQMPYSPLMSQRVIRRARRTAGVVATFHILPSGNLVRLGSRLLRLVQWRSLKQLDAIISVGSAASDFAKHYFAVESKVIPNMVDLDKFKIKTKTESTKDQIVFLGRLVERKGCKQLIKAFALLAKTNPEVELIIAGDGPERTKLEKQVKKLDLQSRVRFLGFVKEQDKPTLLANASVACFPSLYGESFGVVLIEAMAAGARVVLAGDNPGYRTVMEDQPKLLVDSTNSELLAKRLKELLEDRQLVSRLHAWQSQHVQKYDIHIVGPRILAVYHQAIAKSDQRRHN